MTNTFLSSECKLQEGMALCSILCFQFSSLICAFLIEVEYTHAHIIYIIYIYIYIYTYNVYILSSYLCKFFLIIF